MYAVKTGIAFLLFIISQVSSTGVFKLELFSFSNDNALLDSRACCAGQLINNACTQSCQTYFRICLKNYERDITPDACIYGEFTTEVIGNNSFSFPREHGTFTNPLEFQIAFEWPGDFSLIIDAYHEKSQDPQTGDLIASFKGSSPTNAVVSPTDNWKREQWNSTNIESPQSIDFQYRVVCDDTFYGLGCNTICRGRDDVLGHYECDSLGNKICRQGWEGEYCDKAICLAGCSPDRGSCERPNECSCKLGWEGARCDTCIRYPECEHGYCDSAFECKCFEGWGGLYCNQDLNYCTNNEPCRNGGTCSNTGQGSYTCVCPYGFVGVNCEQEVDNCQSQPCQNEATCLDVGNDFECLCPPTYSGRHCEVASGRCADNPCANGGSCMDTGSSYRCMCADGWTGVNCQQEKNECMASPDLCQNGGRCVDGIGTYTCVCAPGYFGSNCQTNNDDCQGENPCQNEGTCVDGVNDFQCRCPLGFVGKLCEINVDDCDTMPCANGGSCVDKVNNFQCFCAPGYAGRMCTDQLNECAVNPCTAGRGTCEDIVNGYICHCDPGYSGKECQYVGEAPDTTTVKTTEPPTSRLVSTAKPRQGGKVGALEEEESNSDMELTQTQLMLIVCFGSGIPMILLLVLVSCLLYRRWRRRVADDKSVEARQNEFNGMNNRIHNPVAPSGNKGDGKANLYEYPTAEKKVLNEMDDTPAPQVTLEYKNSSAAVACDKVVHKDLIKDINTAKERQLLSKANGASRHHQQPLTPLEQQYLQYYRQDRHSNVANVTDSLTADSPLHTRDSHTKNMLSTVCRAASPTAIHRAAGNTPNLSSISSSKYSSQQQNSIQQQQPTFRHSEVPTNTYREPTSQRTSQQQHQQQQPLNSVSDSVDQNSGLYLKPRSQQYNAATAV